MNYFVYVLCIDKYFLFVRVLIYDQVRHTVQGDNPMVQAYCVKCRAKRDIKDPKKITMKNGRPATQGTCPVCKTKVFRIGA